MHRHECEVMGEGGVCSASSGQGRGLMECGHLGILLLSGLFWPDDWNVPVIANPVSASRKCGKKSEQWASVRA